MSLHCINDSGLIGPLNQSNLLIALTTLLFVSLFFKISQVFSWYDWIQPLSDTYRRKATFLRKFAPYYGYSSDVADPRFIDNWRRKEFPGLIPPIFSSSVLGHVLSSIFFRWKNDAGTNEVYLDYAGGSLPTQSQLKAIYDDMRQPNLQVLGNPHSSGPAAARTLGELESVYHIVLNFFGANPTPAQCVVSNNSGITQSVNGHPGYHILFTSGATDSLRIVAENFSWTGRSDDNGGSIFLYSHNSHTSVIGIRGCALQRGASFQCVHISRMLETLDELSSRTSHVYETNNLVVLPLECNFTGSRYDLLAQRITQMAQQKSNQSLNKWFTLLDISKAVATSPINLCSLNPDFACISFYKLFGYPTGVGALFVKRTISTILTGQGRNNGAAMKSTAWKKFFGGGSVDALSPFSEFSLPRSQNAYLSSLIHGTPNYTSIISLKHGFRAIVRLGGMAKIRDHTHSLIVELVTRLRRMRHPNGQRAVVIYGPWDTEPITAIDGGIKFISFDAGPTVSFNLLRPDGSFVGYHEIQKLAALSSPALQLRTGCFCNPGSCQEALDYTDQEMIELATKTLKICGDNKDLIDEKPTGAIRVSFGPYSSFEDLDEFVTFLEKLYIDTAFSERRSYKSNRLDDPSPHDDTFKVQVSELYIFPIKSCAAMRVKEWALDAGSGMLKHDREFAIVDSFGVALRLSAHPKLTLIEPRLDINQQLLLVRAPKCQELIIDISPRHKSNCSQEINLCGSCVPGIAWGDHRISSWFSSFLGISCWLARYNNDEISTEKVMPTFAYANEAPILLISQESVDILNQSLKQQGHRSVSTKHFRPNMVVCSKRFKTSSMTNPEDSWSTLHLEASNILLEVTGRCSRCSMVDIDPSSGMKGQTLKALAKYRRDGGNITFGVFLKICDEVNCDIKSWDIKEGDEIVVK